MFYTRDEKGNKITVEELYTACPVCGKEFDGLDVIKAPGEVDLYTTIMVCQGCNSGKASIL